MNGRGRALLSLLLALVTFAGLPVHAEDVRLDFPETVELKVVVDYVASSLQLNVFYDESQLKKPVSLRVSEPIPKESLLELLRTVLRSRGLVLVPVEQTGWWKIVPTEQLASEGGPLRRSWPPAGLDDSSVVTYVLPVRHAEPEAVRTALAPYLSKPGGSIVVAADSRLLVLTDFADSVRRAVAVAELLDVAPLASAVELIPVRYQDPAELATTVMQLLIESARTEKGAPALPALSLQVDRLSGGLIALGRPEQIASAGELVRRLDQPVARTTELYQPRYLAAARLRTLIDQLVSAAGLKTSIDEPSNTLAVTAREEVHARIRELLDRFDTAPGESATPLRFYKLLNRRADDAFATLGMLLLGEVVDEPSLVTGSQGAAGHRATGGGEGREPPVGPAAPREPAAAGASAGHEAGRGGMQIPPVPPSSADKTVARGEAARRPVQGRDFSLALDEHTNTILALATPEMHRQIETLIRELDKRRPQVLIEVTLVSVSVDDSLDLGVELQTQDLDKDPWRFELFSSFGLTTIDPTTGQRHLMPMAGGTGVLLGPDEVPIIVHALATRGKTHIYSAPRILVDDNATGSIESVAESPYTSVNASNTVATTSFAGFAKAGTQLQIEPHIAEGDHLEIKYDLTVSSFTGSGSATAPPPRSSNTITSTIRVPDGHAVVVGGLLTETMADSTSHVPLIGEVPGLGLLFGQNTQSKSKVRLYAFIRPTILRQEEFEDLKQLTREDRTAAGVKDDYPPDRWQHMR